MERAARGEIWIPREITLRQEDVLGGIADVAHESMTPIIERAPKACAAREQFESLRYGIETEVISAQDDRRRLRRFAGPNLSPVAATGAVDVVVEPPHQIVHHRLHVELAEAAEYFAPDVRFPIAV